MSWEQKALRGCLGMAVAVVAVFSLWSCTNYVAPGVATQTTELKFESNDGIDYQSLPSFETKTLYLFYKPGYFDFEQIVVAVEDDHRVFKTTDFFEILGLPVVQVQAEETTH